MWRQQTKDELFRKFNLSFRWGFGWVVGIIFSVFYACRMVLYNSFLWVCSIHFLFLSVPADDIYHLPPSPPEMKLKTQKSHTQSRKKDKKAMAKKDISNYEKVHNGIISITYSERLSALKRRKNNSCPS